MSERRLRALERRIAALDQALDQARDGLDGGPARRGRRARRRRDELEAKVESYRLLQDRRRAAARDTCAIPKEASTLMAELDLARSVMAKEENDWVRSAEAVTALERKVGRGGEQGGRGRISSRRPSGRGWRSGAGCSRPSATAAVREREASAEQIDKPLRTRYDRLRRSRAREVVVPLVGGTCGACHTVGPAQPPEPDPERRHHRRLRGLRRDPVPGGGGAVGDDRRRSGSLPW